jgi:hypothetical protein
MDAMCLLFFFFFSKATQHCQARGNGGLIVFTGTVGANPVSLCAYMNQSLVALLVATERCSDEFDKGGPNILSKGQVPL